MKMIGVILAGGKSARMGGADKAALCLRGRRIIDYVFDRFRRQVDRLLISGPNDYGLGVTTLADVEGGVKGPAAGIFAVAAWLRENAPDADGFFSAPVDGPFLPENLCARLLDAGGTAIAEDDVSLHPTFAWWRISDLDEAFRTLSGEPSISLRALAKAANARHVRWKGSTCFFNVNTQADLEKAVAILEKTL